MSKTKIVGRIEEYERLEECMNSNQAQLVIVYGRRRVGKTFLINEYFHNTFAFKLTGTYGKEKEVQLTTYGVKQNEYSSVIQNQIIMDDLFYR